MNGIKLLADTNIFIYWQQGFENAANIISTNEIYLSAITELELLSYPLLTDIETASLKEILHKA